MNIQPNNPVRISAVTLAQLATAFNIPRHALKPSTQNDYVGHVAANPLPDSPIVRPDRFNYLDVAKPLSPIITDLHFKSISYIVDFDTQRRITLPEIFMACVLINISQAKKVIKTDIDGRDGTVKEYIGKDDYAVGISGILTETNGKHPFDQIATLERMLAAPVPIPVVNKHLNNLNIHFLVVESYDIPQAAGNYSQQPFTISTISDMPIELQLQ